MIPDSIEFHGGVSFNPEQFVRPRCISGPIPASWARVRFETPRAPSLAPLDRWLAENIVGRWASYSLLQGGKNFVYVAFENLQDAIMFRLKGGETAFLNDT